MFEPYLIIIKAITQSSLLLFFSARVSIIKFRDKDRSLFEISRISPTVVKTVLVKILGVATANGWHRKMGIYRSLPGALAKCTPIVLLSSEFLVSRFVGERRLHCEPKMKEQHGRWKESYGSSFSHREKKIVSVVLRMRKIINDLFTTGKLHLQMCRSI